ncbi:glycosyltransferase family 4 protein [Arcticibacter sp.]|uniref:glycosyltransferase family 4 protein n=1 Tax=Arcticibacter sp. TaxID=1872630 RepID=UPI00388DE593
MEHNKNRVLIACDSSRSLLDFRGKLMEALMVQNEVHVFTPKIQNKDIKSRLVNMGVTVYENELESSNVSIWSDIKYISSLFTVLKKVKPAVFFPYAFKPVIYGSLMARYLGIKRIAPMLTGLGNNFDNNGTKTLVNKITRNLLKQALKHSEKIRIILQNPDDRHTLHNFKIINNKYAGQVFIVNGSGVDLAHYDYSEPGEGNVSFLMVSRLINAKGIREFYEAAKEIGFRYPHVRFRLVGPFDNNIDSIDEELFSKIQAGEVLEYLGEVNDIRGCIRDSSVVVLPSYYGEGVPRCILEAMAMGRAVITTNSVGCRETVSNDKEFPNGFLIPVKDVNSLVQRMEHFIKNKNDILRFGLNGRKYAQEKFDVDIVNQQMLKILTDA